MTNGAYRAVRRRASNLPLVADRPKSAYWVHRFHIADLVRHERFLHWKLAMWRGTSRSEAMSSPMHSLRTLEGAHQLVAPDSGESLLTFEAFVWDHRITERLIVLVHHSLLATFANDLARVAT